MCPRWGGGGGGGGGGVRGECIGLTDSILLSSTLLAGG